ncbi:restriction endonuclease subunit S [Psychrobacter sp. ANT_H59]|uniref:restriction endonuclease subunit S n=1 Tax=Psychrobacter sp. ANT_H59 TaxID=2597354 RepID=UPI0011F08824|nr:restriction endonuclease subunit S [Psychrobacter sp. ANT_H59]KAA0939709.1 restriction endonuclease subunit S [Psychrobacter sp. ANT_H59]
MHDLKGWVYEKLGDLPILFIDSDRSKRYPKRSEFQDQGIAFLNAESISSGRFDRTKVNHIPYEKYEEIKKGRVENGDVVLTMRGNGVGDAALIFGEGILGLINAQMLILRPNDETINSKFLYYGFISPQFKCELSNFVSGSAQPQLTMTHLRHVPFRVPPLAEQKAIAHILGSLDDKIELNRQMNETLEAMAQAMFKSWFVDFDPVIDNALAAGNAIPDEFIERAEQRKGIEKKDNSDTQGLFPDAFEFTEEMGWIPKGWEVKPLDEVANYLNGLALQKYRPENIDDDYLPVVKIAQLREGLANHDEKASINIKPEYIIDNGDVIFSWSGSLLVDVWCGGKAALNQHLFKVTSEEYPKWFYLNYTKYHLAEFQRIATDKAVTMGHIKRGHLKEALCVIPENRVDDNIFAVFEDILNKQISSKIESQNIAKLRDTLLPKLMSGELRIADAEALVDEAV